LNWTGPVETEYVFTRPVLYLQRTPGPIQSQVLTKSIPNICRSFSFF